MNSTRVTVGGLFGIGPDGLSSDQLPDLTSTEAYSQLREQMQDKAGAAWKMMGDKLPEHTGKLLDIDLVKLLVDGWNKARDLRKYRDEVAYPPDETVVAVLTKHKHEVKLSPHLELVVAERPIGRLHFTIDLALTIEGAELTIQAGRIKSIATGRTSGIGTLKCEGVVVGQKDKKLAVLPGRIDLGSGIPIPA